MNVACKNSKLSILKTVILSMSLVSSVPVFGSVATQKREVDQFLRRVGFEDYVATMKENAAKGVYIHSQAKDKSASVLAEQIKHYEIFNDTRELTSELVALLHDETRDQAETRRDLIQFTAQMIRNAPLMPTTEFPASVDNEEKAWDFAWNAAVERIESHVKKVSADLIKVLVDGRTNEKTFAENPYHDSVVGYQTKFNYLRVRIVRVLKFAYLNEVMGKSNYFAKGLVAALVREDIKAGNTKFADALSKEINPEGFYVENFVGTTLKLKNSKGVISDINIQNGDFLNVRSYGMEAWQISFAVRPQGAGNLFLGLKHDLIGAPGGHVLFPEDGQQPKVDFSVKGILKDALSKSDMFNRGFSHLGMAMVKTDAETGLEVPWSIDVYPNAGLGGIRILDIPTQYFRDEYYFRFGVSRYSPEKLLKQLTKEPNYKAVLNFQMVKNPEDPNAEVVLWKTGMSEKNYKAMIAAGAKDPKAWFERIMRKSTDLVISDYLGKGLGFAHGFKNQNGQAYCSQMVLLAIYQATGIDAQPKIDQWNKLLQTLKEKGHEAAKEVDTGLRVISPAGFMWQKDLVDDKATQIIEYPFVADEFERAKKAFIAEYNPIVKSDYQAVIADSDFDDLIKIPFSAGNYSEVAGNDQYSYEMILGMRARAEQHRAALGDVPDRFFPSFMGASRNAINQRFKSGQ